MRSTILSLMTLAALAPAVLSAQTTAQTDATAEAQIHAAIEQAASVGVPIELLESKIAEGRAKGIPMARIAAAVQHRADVLARVQAALESRASGATGGEATTGELIAAADAHEAGISLESLASLSAGAGNDRSAALTVLADLVASGTVPEHALLRVQAALNGGAAALVQLGNSAAAAAAAARPAPPAAQVGGSAGAGAGAQAGGAGNGAGASGGASVGVKIGG